MKKNCLSSLPGPQKKVLMQLKQVPKLLLTHSVIIMKYIKIYEKEESLRSHDMPFFAEVIDTFYL